MAARLQNNCTTVVRDLVLRILVYLRTHPERGPYYSPENEERFYKMLSENCEFDHEEFGDVTCSLGEMPDVVAFCDADFGGMRHVFSSLRSTSASVVFYRGC